MILCALFVRHGSTLLNDEGKFRGPIDVDLDDKGIRQAEEVRDFLAGRVFSAAYSSSKKRTRETARIVLEGNGIKVTPLTDLDALNVGFLAGQPKDAHNREIMEHYEQNPHDKIPGGERLEDFQHRTDPKINMIVQKGYEAGHPVIAFVHSSIIHEVSKVFHGDHNKVKVEPGGVVGVYKTTDGFEAKPLLREMPAEKDRQMVS